MNRQEFIEQLNKWGKARTPFLFIVDFEFKKPIAFKASEVPQAILFSFGDVANESLPPTKCPIVLTCEPVTVEEYSRKFNVVAKHLSYGNSYLTNLTIKTPVAFSGSLEDVFHAARAPYRLCLRDQFVVYSPECFVRIKDGKIFSFPMKGTIDAALPQAEDIIMNDPKELAEHVTIVDLIRNDLSRVAENVHVPRFRYVEKIPTNNKTLLQVSSEVVGTLPVNYAEKIGTILSTLLPAGSVSGAPKDKTVAIIQEAEGEERGYYTGIMGYFDGQNLESAVMIRYIEKSNGRYYYRSGGGITTQSALIMEYEEVLAKIYVPAV